MSAEDGYFQCSGVDPDTRGILIPNPPIPKSLLNPETKSEIADESKPIEKAKKNNSERENESELNENLSQ